MQYNKAIILHVEDDPDWQEIVCEFVQFKDHIVAIQVNTVAQALATIPNALHSRAINIVILDSDLPDGSGEQVAKTLRKHHVPVVVIALADRVIRDVDAMVSKKRPDELSRAIRTVLQNSKWHPK